MLELIAYHEAGHALVALLMGGQVQQVTIEPDHDDGPQREGDTRVLWRGALEGDRRFARAAVQVCLGGPVAEMIYSGDPYHPGFVAQWAGDWRDAWQAARHLVSDERQRLAFLERTTVELYRQLEAEPLWSALASIADHLLAHETLDGEQLAEIAGVWLE